MIMMHMRNELLNVIGMISPKPFKDNTLLCFATQSFISYNYEGFVQVRRNSSSSSINNNRSSSRFNLATEQ